MLDLDFAFFNLQDQDRKGLAGRKYFLDRLAPFLFGPRIERLVEVPQLGAGCNIHLPLGAGNVNRMEAAGQRRVFEQTSQLLMELKLDQMAADRSLRQAWPNLEGYFSLIWGDDFIKALAYTLAREIVSRRGADKIVLVGEVLDYSDLLEALIPLGVPLSVQTTKPADYEVMTYRLLYERGCAVSNSLLNPDSWDKNHLVLLFDGDSSEYAAVWAGRYLIRLTSSSRGLAPDLEHHLDESGLGGWLGIMAPIMESCLKSKAGIFSANDEQDMSRSHPPFLALQESAEELGVWDLFLDKGFSGIYNT